MPEETPERSMDTDGGDSGAHLPRGVGAASALASDTNIDNLGLEASSTDSTPSTPATTPPDSSSSVGDETTIVGDAAPKAEVIGDFEIHDKLGQGGMGAVYRARQISLDRWVALKILPASLEADDTFVTRFQREARIAASLNHGNLVRVYSSGQADGCHYIAMELVDGETLGQWLKRGALPPMESLRICLDVARALDHGWRHAQLIHRDIKPGNIFLSQEGDVKVGDLGLAKSMGADTTGLTHTGTAMGTPHYISPEQARGEKDLDFHADIYSLGCTLYQMLTGRTPYDGRDPLSVMNQHINSPPPALLKVLPQCPIPLARLVGKMLKKSKRERHASYEELIAQIASVQTLFAPAESPLESTLPPDRDATLLETPGAFATPRSATPATAPVARTTATPTKKKSPVLLYAGLGIGALVIGAAVMLLSPGKDGIRKAPASSTGTRQSAAPAPVGSGPDADEASRAISNAGGENWQNVLRDDGQTLKLLPGARFTPEGLFLGKNSSASILATIRGHRNGALRARFRFDGARPQLTVRANEAGTYNLSLKSQETLSLVRYDVGSGRSTTIKEFALSEPLTPGKTYELELRVIGSTLTAKFQGAVLGSAEDTHFTKGAFGFGNYVINAPEPMLQSMEFLDLDSVADSAVSAGSEAWQNVLLDAGRSLSMNLGTSITADGLRLGKNTTVTIRNLNAIQRDGALRARTKFDDARPQLTIRSSSAGAYNLKVKNANTLWIQRWDGSTRETTTVKEFPLSDPLIPGRTFVFELRAVGQTFTAKLDDEILGSVEDHTFSSGSFGAGNYTSDPFDGLLETLEFLDLDAAAKPVTGPSSEPWRDMLRGEVKLSLDAGAELTAEGLRAPKNGKVFVESGPDKQGDAAIRVRYIFDEIVPQLTARWDPEARFNLATPSPNTVRLTRWQNSLARSTTIKEFQLASPLQPGQQVELELRAVGKTLTIKLNGAVLGTAEDSAPTRGYFGMAVIGTKGDTGVIPEMSFLDLEKK